MCDVKNEKKESIENIEKMLSDLNLIKDDEKQDDVQKLKNIFVDIKVNLENEKIDDLKAMKIVVNLPVLYIEVEKLAVAA